MATAESPVSASVTLRLMISINDGPPIEIGTAGVQVGDTRGQLGDLLRQAADEIDNGAKFRPRYVLGLGRADEGAGREACSVDRSGRAGPDRDE